MDPTTPGGNFSTLIESKQATVQALVERATDAFFSD